MGFFRAVASTLSSKRTICQNIFNGSSGKTQLVFAPQNLIPDKRPRKFSRGIAVIPFHDLLSHPFFPSSLRRNRLPYCPATSSWTIPEIGIYTTTLSFSIRQFALGVRLVETATHHLYFITAKSSRIPLCKKLHLFILLAN